MKMRKEIWNIVSELPRNKKKRKMETHIKTTNNE